MALALACLAGMVTDIVPLLPDHGLCAAPPRQVLSSLGISLLLGHLGVCCLIEGLLAPGVAAV
ncbi:MFS transporter, partial [Pseudomonas aeruginosa]